MFKSGVGSHMILDIPAYVVVDIAVMLLIVIYQISNLLIMLFLVRVWDCVLYGI